MGRPISVVLAFAVLFVVASVPSCGVPVREAGGDKTQVDEPRRSLLDSPAGHRCGSKIPSKSVERAIGRAVVEWSVREKKHQRALGRARKIHHAIPTYFHIIQKDDTVGKMSQSDIDGYMTALNGAYQGTGFTFVLKNIKVYIKPTRYEISNQRSARFARRHNIRGADVLNIYFCNTFAWFEHFGWYLPNRHPGSNEESIFVTNTQTLTKDDAYATIIHEVSQFVLNEIVPFVRVYLTHCLLT